MNAIILAIVLLSDSPVSLHLSWEGGDPTSAAVVVEQEAPSTGSGAIGPLTHQVAPEPSPEFAPTSHEAIQFALSMYRGVRPEHTFGDPGVGDGRILIAAVRKWGCRGLGVEINPDQAALARRCVEAAGLSDRITIVEGDATKLDWESKVDAAFAFLYPETLEAMASKLARIPAVVSYQHDVPGLGLKETRSQYGKFYSKDPVAVAAVQAQPVVKVVQTAPYADWGGRRYYSEYNPRCNCAMCQSIRRDLTIPRTTTVVVQPEQHAAVAPQPQRRGHFQKQCLNGVCQIVWVWDE